MEQIKINIGKEWDLCVFLRKKINFLIENKIELQQKINLIKLEEPYKTEKEKFNNFIRETFEKTYEEQQNNHNLMYTFLKERILTHIRINYAFLEETLAKNKIPYGNNLAPKKILSNYYFSNKNEKLLEVKKLEDNFVSFTRSNDIILLSDDKNIKDIIKYFALQFTRREFYLLDIIKYHMNFFNKQSFNELDLLDYLMIKYIYNITLENNFKNWLDHIEKDNAIVYQIQYRKSLKEISQKEASLLDNSENTEPCNLAISEAHTFIISEILNGVGIENLEDFFVKNNLDFFTTDEIKSLDDIYVTIGSDNKLCYLLNAQISPDIFEKINILIHHCWDEFISCRTLITLLLKKDSELNNIDYFKKLDNYVYENSKFMHEAFEFSNKYEKIIKG